MFEIITERKTAPVIGSLFSFSYHGDDTEYCCYCFKLEHVSHLSGLVVSGLALYFKGSEFDLKSCY
jgi:hypothetical protein